MSKRWVTVECERLAVVQLQRCAEAVQLCEEDDYRLLDAIRFAHLSMIAAMTAALNGTAGVGALTHRSRERVEQAYRAGAGSAFAERTMFYDELLEAVMAPGRMEWSDPLELSEDELTAARCLDGDRKLVDHPKPTTWMLSIEDIRARLSLIGPIVRRLMEAVPHHYTQVDRQLVDAACQSLTQ